MYYFPFSCKLFFSFNLHYDVVFLSCLLQLFFPPYLFIFIQSFIFQSPAHEIFHTKFSFPFTCSWDFSYKVLFSNHLLMRFFIQSFAFHSLAHEIFHTKFYFPITCSWDFSYKVLLSIHLLMRFFIQTFCFPFTCSWNSKTIPQSAFRNTLSRRILWNQSRYQNSINKNLLSWWQELIAM
jgi:hypothetical protein